MPAAASVPVGAGANIAGIGKKHRSEIAEQVLPELQRGADETAPAGHDATLQGPERLIALTAHRVGAAGKEQPVGRKGADTTAIHSSQLQTRRPNQTT